VFHLGQLHPALIPFVALCCFFKSFLNFLLPTMSCCRQTFEKHCPFCV
jgi:hypothetical protein